MTQSVIEKLDALAEFQSQRDLLMLDKQKAIDSVITPEVKQQIADIEAEFSSKSSYVVTNITELETAIKNDVLSEGETVKGTRLQAVWAKGRVSWDDKSLSGYAKAHPELNEFRKQGEPSVSIRQVK